MSVLDLVDAGQFVRVRPGHTPGFKMPWGEQEPHMPVTLRCARCPEWFAHVTVGERRAVWAAHTATHRRDA